MSSEAKRLNKERRITAETYSKTKTHTICIYKKFTDKDYVIWVKMFDLQKRLCHQNLCYVAMKTIKSFCDTKYPTKEKVNKYKIKMSQCINDDKSVCICEDLAYKSICYINPGVIEANEFRKNLGVENDKSIRIEREIITIITKIFAKENMVRQYQIFGLLYRVNLCFVDHKLVIEINEDGQPCYENDKIRQKLEENHGFTFSRIDSHLDAGAGFDLDVGIAKIQNYINESSLKLAVDSAEKSLKEKFAKELFSYILSFSGTLKYVKYLKYCLPYKNG